ncbi:hypothetical protein FEP90_04901 [Burkholderia multivorans]|nr:hypothetical protein [Burkholderia multivorans]
MPEAGRPDAQYRNESDADLQQHSRQRRDLYDHVLAGLGSEDTDSAGSSPCENRSRSRLARLRRDAAHHHDHDDHRQASRRVGPGEDAGARCDPNQLGRRFDHQRIVDHGSRRRSGASGGRRHRHRQGNRTATERERTANVDFLLAPENRRRHRYAGRKVPRHAAAADDDRRVAGDRHFEPDGTNGCPIDQCDGRGSARPDRHGFRRDGR